MDTLGARLLAAADALSAVSDTPRLDAELLLAQALGFSRTRLLSHLHDRLDSAAFEAMLARRMNHEPVAYILGTWEFYALEFAVRAPVLVPRPETEHLVEAALEAIAGTPHARVLDLCTGSGCVAIAVAKHSDGARVDAVDVQPHAVALARENAERLQAAVSVYEGDLFAALPTGAGPYHAITGNPPYIALAEYDELPLVIQKHEDPVALLSGGDGLDLVRRILVEAVPFIVPGGMLALEIGDTQAAAVRALAEAAGWRDVAFIRDLAGHERIFTARR